MAILIDINNLIEEANAATAIAKPVTTAIGAAAKPAGSMVANLYKGSTNALSGISKTWNSLSPGVKTAVAGLGGVGVAGLGLAAGHTLGAAPFAPTANLLHLAPANGALHALKNPMALTGALAARRAIQTHYNG